MTDIRCARDGPFYTELTRFCQLCGYKASIIGIIVTFNFKSPHSGRFNLIALKLGRLAKTFVCYLWQNNSLFGRNRVRKTEDQRWCIVILCID